MFFLLPLIGAAVGAAAGAFATHAAGEKDRQAAKYHRKVANDLSTKYDNLQKRYHEYAKTSKKQILDLTRQRALDEAEKDLLRLAIRLQQGLYKLMWEIDDRPTYESLSAFKRAVLATNTVLLELREEFVQVPDRYFSRNLERADNSSIALLDEDIYPIKQCPTCKKHNRILPHDLKLSPICGSCGASLLESLNANEQPDRNDRESGTADPGDKTSHHKKHHEKSERSGGKTHHDRKYSRKSGKSRESKKKESRTHS